jgi:AcrR family transcriptional regulator
MLDMKTLKRRYTMTSRAEAASATKARILASARRVMAENTFDGMTLESVAAGARTTVRTVLRVFESKELLFASALDTLGERGHGPIYPGDIRRTVGTVFEFYEKFGDTVIRWLADEHRIASMHAHLAVGRQHLRFWVNESFAPTLDLVTGRKRRQMIDGLIVALDVYTWKLLRRDFRLKPDAARAVVQNLVAGITQGV